MKARIAVLALALLAAGCTGTPAPAPSFVSPPAWTEPAAYRFVVDRRCAGQPSQGRYRVTVAGGAVTARERIDGRTATGEEEIEAPSLGELTEMAQTAIDDGAEVTTRYDPGDGHPVEVSITREVQECFVISEYAAG